MGDGVDFRKIKFEGQVPVKATINGTEKVVGFANMEKMADGDHVAHVTFYVGMGLQAINNGFSLGELTIKKTEGEG